MTVFNVSQWEFLAIMEVCREPVSVGIIGSLAPLNPGELFDLIRKCTANEWIHQDENDSLWPSDKLAPEVESKLVEFNSPARIASIIDTLESGKMLGRLSKSALARLLQRAGRGKRALQLEIQLATHELHITDIVATKQHLNRIDQLLPVIDSLGQKDDWFLTLQRIFFVEGLK